MDKKRSLKWFLIISVVIAISVPLFISGAIFTTVLGNSIKKQIVSTNESLTKSFVNQIEDYLNNSLNDLQSLKTIIDKQDFEMVRYDSLLDSIRKNKKHFTKIQIINKIGFTKYVSPYDKAYIGMDLSKSKFFNETIKTGKPYWSATFISPQSNQPVVSVSIPFENGVITGFLSLNKLTEAAKKIGSEKSIHVTITDQTSTYIAHYKDKLVQERAYDPNYDMLIKKYSGKVMSMVLNQDGESMFATASIIKKTNWVIVFLQPASKVFEPIRILNFYMIIGAMFIILVTTFLCLKHTSVIINIISKFTKSAQTLTLGNYNKIVKDIKYKEFSDLADQFNSMANAIKVREIELVEKEEKYRSIFTAAKDAILILDSNTGQILDVNIFACELYGYSKEEFIELKAENLSNEPEKTKQTLINRTDWIPKRIHSKKDGTLIIVEVTVSYHKQARGINISTAVIRDITKRIEQEEEKRQMETKLNQSQKMEAIGRLAGGIAHDFNNILAAIVGFSELVQLNIKKGSEEENYIAHVLTASMRAKELVNQILTFACSSKTEKRPIIVKLILDEVVKFIRATIPKSIEIKTSIQSKKTVMANSTQLHQVVMNLCTNAWHAMKENGGSIDISLKDVDVIQSTSLETKRVPPGQYLLLRIEDNGQGIDKMILSKIFDPYFTTKKTGEGSGMGLSVVQGIIGEINGFIDVKSEHGKGSIFSIYLPAIETIDENKNIKAISIQQGTETIMVVDDETEITEMIVLYLKKLGYNAIGFNDSKDALESIKKNPKAFDAVVTDMAMPQMTGDRLAKEINQINSNLPIIICTGFSKELTDERMEAIGVTKLLMKPVANSELAESIRNILDK